jgi:hypothetical protein
MVIVAWRRPTTSWTAAAIGRPVALAYPCAMDTAISSWVQRMISGLFPP